MHISVLISTYKRHDVLRKTLQSFCLLDFNDKSWELLIVDNAVDDFTEKVVNDFKNKLPIKFFIEPNSGKNVALNTALPHAQGEFLIFTDDDILPNPDWLEQLWQGAQRWSGHKIFGGRIIADWPNGIPFWGDNHPLNQSLFSLHCPSEEERPYGEGDFLPYGPNMAVRREIFDKGYKFNPNIGPTSSTVYRMGSETEFLQRLKDDGYIPVFLPNAVVKHQIRPEQLTPLGLNRRNFRVGLSDIDPANKPTNIFFASARHLWKQLVMTKIDFLKAKLTSNPVGQFESTSRSWRLRGKIYAQRHYSGVSKNSFLQKYLECK